MESLEDRTVPATLSVSNSVLQYTAAVEANNLTVSVSGDAFHPVITIHDSGAVIQTQGPGFTQVDAHTVTVDTSLSSPVIFNSIVLDVGDGADVVNVQSTDLTPVTVRVGTGSQTINIGNGNLDFNIGRVTIEGSTPGTATVNLLDQNGDFPFYDITSQRVEVGDTALDYSNVVRGVTLNLFPGGGNDIRVHSTSASTPVTVNGSGFVSVGDQTNSLDAIQGALTVTGGGHFSFYDGAAAAGHTYTLTPTSLTRSGAAVMTFPAWSNLRVTGTSFNDSLVLQSLLRSGLELDMGAGFNTVYGPNTNNTWVIGGAYGVGHATLNGMHTIDGIGNLVGGTASDCFVFLQGGRIPGTVNGGGGGDTLDYSDYNAGVNVNLAAYHTSISGPPTYGYATGTGNVTNIQTVIGSRYGDVLAGGYYGSVLVGGDGNDTLTAYRGGSSRNVLIGGLGSDILQGGLADDILIGGDTAFDTNPAALTAIFREWSRTDTAATYQHRIDDLMGVRLGDPNRQNGSYFLNSKTVYDDGLKDNCSGGGGMDWFWA